MSQSKEIFRTAMSLIEEYGVAAVQHAAVVISERQQGGDDGSAEMWRNIQAAISILRDAAVRGNASTSQPAGKSAS